MNFILHRRKLHGGMVPNRWLCCTEDRNSRPPGNQPSVGENHMELHMKRSAAHRCAQWDTESGISVWGLLQKKNTADKDLRRRRLHLYIRRRPLCHLQMGARVNNGRVSNMDGGFTSSFCLNEANTVRHDSSKKSSTYVFKQIPWKIHHSGTIIPKIQECIISGDIW